MNAEPDALLLLSHLRVQNANAISGPFTWGFPAPSAFTGFAHALSRKLPEALDMDIHLDGVGIVCHRFEPQIAGGYVKSFRLTRNPVDEKGEPTPFVEEGRAHLEVSLLLGVGGDAMGLLTEDELPAVARRILSIAQCQRLAGGSVLPVSDNDTPEPQLLFASEQEMRRLKRRLLPGFALIGRDERLQERLQELREQQADVTALDALLDLSALHWDCEVADSAGEQTAHWYVRPRRGWLVPVPVGYAAISPLYEAGAVRNARDTETPLRFVESIYSLGEWINPLRIEDPRRLLWRHRADPERGIYRCINTLSSSIEHIFN